jgi:serine/threonine-protein kinase HipA
MTFGEMTVQRNATATVFLNDRRVGVLGYHAGNTWFEYTDLVPEHPVLGQGFERNPLKRRTASGSIPEWFANLLPETGSGLRQLVASELGKKTVHDFALICYLGEDLPGAVRVVPDADLSDLPDHEAEEKCEHDHSLRFSLAGVQPKFSVRHDGKALVLPATGTGGDWIVKLPDRRFPAVPENEYAMLQWASMAGISTPQSELVRGADIRNLPADMIEPAEYALAVRRFDRTEKGRVHQEDFAQVRETAIDNKYDRATYEGIGRVIKHVGAEGDPIEYVRRLAAFIVMGNSDAHLKNWTLRYADGRAASLSPAYDLVCVTAYPADHKLAFPLGGTRDTSLITHNNFRQLADSMDIASDLVVDTVKATCESLAASWHQLKQEFPVPDFVAKNIEGRLSDLPLVKG